MRLGALILPLVLVLLASGSARSASNEDLAGFTNREYVDYARDRFEWLTGEARSSHTLAKKFHHLCDGATAAGGNDAGRACDIAKAADEQGVQVLKEGQDLIQGLQKRLGHVPTWAHDADAALAAALGK
jgi:hypothetical protein